VLTALIVRPLRSLTVVANELSNGNVDVELPDIQTRDEIRDLADAIRGVMAALVTLVGEVEALSSAARPAASSEEEPGQGAHQQEAE
jgi:HAMP domain-containing protein